MGRACSRAKAQSARRAHRAPRRRKKGRKTHAVRRFWFYQSPTPPQQWRGQDLLRIMGDSERNASSADDPECAPSDLLDLMIAWKAKIRLQIDRDLQVGGQHQAKNEQPDGMQYIIDVLLDQNEQLVCSLVELEREALKRTAQMQKRLQSTAITTRVM
ncbi:hypothetical protein MRX96_010420 [Rhipicephalus microplus]